jgi:hypothetical protein
MSDERHDERHDADDGGELDPRLREAAAALPKSVEPARDLWPGIEARIREERVVVADFRPWWRRRGVLVAAAAAVVIVVAGLTGRVLDRRGGEAPAPELAEAPRAEAPRGEAPPVWTNGNAAAYAASRDDVLTLLTERGEELDPETVAEIRRNLEIIDEAIANIREALAEDPGNPELEDLLNAGYRRGGATLRRTVGLTETI